MNTGGATLLKWVLSLSVTVSVVLSGEKSSIATRTATGRVAGAVGLAGQEDGGADADQLKDGAEEEAVADHFLHHHRPVHFKHLLDVGFGVFFLDGTRQKSCWNTFQNKSSSRSSQSAVGLSAWPENQKYRGVLAEYVTQILRHPERLVTL